MTSFRKTENKKPARRGREAGVALPGGLAIAAITAAIVFAVGSSLLPTAQPAPPVVQAPPPPPPPPPAPPAPASTADAATVDARATSEASASKPAAEAEAGVAKASKPAAPAEAEAPPRAQAAAPPAPAETAAASPIKASDKDLQAYKIAAHESWRANKPDISAAGGRASIIIPIKGTTDGASSKFLPKTRTLVVTLPRAASLNTMKFYRLNREGFLSLWVDQAETNPRPKDGSKLKIVMGVRAEPQVELGDGFVRATIFRPERGAAAGEAKPAPAEPDEDDKSKDKDKDKDKEREKEKDKD